MIHSDLVELLCIRMVWTWWYRMEAHAYMLRVLLCRVGFQVVNIGEEQSPTVASDQLPPCLHSLLAVPHISNSAWAASSTVLQMPEALQLMLEVLDINNTTELHKQGCSHLPMPSLTGVSQLDNQNAWPAPRFCREGLCEGLSQLLRACHVVVLPLSCLSGSSALAEFLEVVGEVGCALSFLRLLCNVLLEASSGWLWQGGTCAEMHMWCMTVTPGY